MCFTGHRRPSDYVPLPALWADTEATVKALYRSGFRRFICGGARGFDTMAASAVLQLKHTGCGDLSLLLALPCEDQARGWTEPETQMYRAIREEADRLVVLSPHYYTGCMMVRNRFMVDHSGLCVAFLCKSKGGTASTVRYAIHEGLPVLNLAVPEEVTRFLTDLETQPLPF